MSYSFNDGEPKLDFLTQKIHGMEVYIIPDDKKEAVLNELYPFEGVLGLNEEKYDLHAGRKFIVKDFMVTREGNMNYLVSPYYFDGGGSVIDWMPVDSF
jgi:hypothetical protein